MRKIPDITLCVWILALAILAGLWGIFSHWTATSWISFPHFLAAIAVLFVIPGRLMLRLLRLRGPFLDMLLMATVLGAISTSACFVITSWLGVPLLTWTWVGTACLALLLEIRSLAASAKRLPKAPGLSHLMLLLALAAGFLLPAIAPFCWQNLARLPGGELSYAKVVDTLMHASIVSELTHSMPPQVPFMAGNPLCYHVGMDVVEAAVSRLCGLSVMDLVTRFFPALFMTLAILAPFCVGRRLTGSGMAGACVAFLVVLGEDLAFIPGISQGLDAVWCSAYLSTPTAFSLCYVNPMIVAVGLLFTCLLCLNRSLRETGGGWAVALALCAGSLFETKLFTFVHLAMAMGLASLVCIPRVRSILMFKELLAIGLIGAPLMVLTLMANQESGKFVWMWSPGLQYYVRAGFRAMQWPWLAKHALIGLPIYLIMVFGMRIPGLWEMGRIVRRPPREEIFGWVLVALVLTGPVVSLVSKVVPVDRPAVYNNAIWFIVQSKYVAWLLAVPVFLGLWRQWSSALPRLGLILAVAIGTLPSTVQLLIWVRMNTHPAALDRSLVESLDFLRHEARAGEVVFSSEEGPLLCTTRLRVPFYSIYAVSFARDEDLLNRKADKAAFWEDWRHDCLRADLLARYRVSWVLASRKEKGRTFWEREDDPARDRRIDRVFKSGGFAVFKVNLEEKAPEAIPSAQSETGDGDTPSP